MVWREFQRDWLWVRGYGSNRWFDIGTTDPTQMFDKTGRPDFHQQTCRMRRVVVAKVARMVLAPKCTNTCQLLAYSNFDIEHTMIRASPRHSCSRCGAADLSGLIRYPQ